MGFHTCEYCHNATSSGDITLRFANGRAWEMPDMIVHYIEVHDWQPPAEFVSDVMTQTLIQGERLQTKSLVNESVPTKIGYLSGPFTALRSADPFKLKLRQLIDQASKTGDRAQTRGMTPAIAEP